VTLRFFIVIERVDVDPIDRLPRGEQILNLPRAPSDTRADTLPRTPAHLFEQTHAR